MSLDVSGAVTDEDCGRVARDAAFAPDIAYDSLTAEARRTILVATLNVVAGAVLAHRTGDVDLSRWPVRELGGTGERPWGTRAAVPLYDAAMINAAAAHVFAYDDTADVLLGHPSVCLVPAILAGAPDGLGTPDFLRAYASGYETMTMLGRLMNPDHYARGFHATATLGTVAAANAVGVVRGLSPAERAATVGIACAQAGGLRASIGYPLRAWHAGFAARRGLESADLAELGVRPNPETVLGLLGFVESFGRATATSATAASATATALPAPDGAPAINGRDVLNLKTFPGCGAVGPAAVAISDAVRFLRAAPSDVVSLDVEVNPFVLDVVTTQWPELPAGAGFSLLYVVTVALAYGDVAPFHFAASHVDSGPLRRLSEVVTLRSGLPGSTKYEARATVTLRDGRSATRQQPGVGGTPAREFTPDDVVARWVPRGGAGAPEALRAAARDFVDGAEPDFRSRLDTLVRVLEGTIGAPDGAP